MQGRILKNQNGYFSVYGETGTLSLCRSRGRLKRETEILVGDFVEYETGAGSEATITRVFPRKNRLYRPPVSNIDTLVLTVAIRTPDVSRYVLDTMLLLAEDAEISPVVCINKCDLDPEAAENLAALYRRVGRREIQSFEPFAGTGNVRGGQRVRKDGAREKHDAPRGAFAAQRCVLYGHAGIHEPVRRFGPAGECRVSVQRVSSLRRRVPFPKL